MAQLEQVPMSHFLEPLLRIFKHVFKIDFTVLVTKKVCLFQNLPTKKNPRKKSNKKKRQQSGKQDENCCAAKDAYHGIFES